MRNQLLPHQSLPFKITWVHLYVCMWVLCPGGGSKSFPFFTLWVIPCVRSHSLLHLLKPTVMTCALNLYSTFVWTLQEVKNYWVTSEGLHKWARRLRHSIRGCLKVRLCSSGKMCQGLFVSILFFFLWYGLFFLPFLWKQEVLTSS